MALLFDPDAMSGVPQQIAERALRKSDWLWAHRLLVTHSPLSENLSGYFKRHIGKYRIFYSYDPELDDMIIHLVGHRDTIYKDAADLKP